MLIAEIIGTVTSTVKVKKIEGTKLKIARTIDPDGKPTGRYFIVEDGVGVGSGEIVLLSDCLLYTSWGFKSPFRHH